MTDNTGSWFATCPKGLESLLLQELQSLGAEDARETVAGVYFGGPPVMMYRACVWSRLANRILLPVTQVDAADEAQFYQGIREIDWGGLFSADRSFAIDFYGHNKSIRHSRFGAQRAKDAIVDQFVAATGQRPDVDLERPEVRINVRLVRDKAHVSVDLSGGSLHRRGYRQGAGSAPLKENLAAAILLRADWPGIAARGGALIDPLCGSGTLLLEGAMMALGIAPGLARERFGFEGLKLHNAAQWRAILADARGQAERGRAAQPPEIRGYDWDPAVIRRAQEGIAQAGLQKVVRVSCKPVSKLTKPSHKPLPFGLLVCNPPYGERIGEKKQLRELYRQLGSAMLAEFAGWQAAILTSDLELGKATGLRSHKRYTLYNGTIAASLLLFDLANNTFRDPGQGVADTASEESHSSPPLSEGAAMFGNRIRKNRKRLSGWVRREQVECYRVYDADMPEYAVAVDVYGDQVHVAEYKAPSGVSPEAAQRRLDEVRAALPEALGIPDDRIVYKQRSRQRGTAQYNRLDKQKDFFIVREGQARLRVNLTDYLDTGLFLDHRPLRSRIAKEAADKDFLNLFCYTGSATVHAALGGARSTTSVDLSRTYLEWLGKNLALNKLESDRNDIVREDCRAWLANTNKRFDLILLDPPTFSNSKSMEDSFDVQRDQGELVRCAMAVLRPGGQLYFSNNRRGFALDDELKTEFDCEDISAKTIPEDFKRNRKIHTCWIIRHRDGA